MSVVTINTADFRRITQKLDNLQTALKAKDGAVLKYLFNYVALGYRDAVLSGIGTVPANDVFDRAPVHKTLKSFMDTSVSVNWNPLAASTILKKKDAGLSMSIWMATGDTADKVVKDVYFKQFPMTSKIFVGIDGSKNKAVFDRAIAAEFGGVSNPGGREFKGRALFTLLNQVFRSQLPQIRVALKEKLREAIQDVGWGK